MYEPNMNTANGVAAKSSVAPTTQPSPASGSAARAMRANSQTQRAPHTGPTIQGAPASTPSQSMNGPPGGNWAYTASPVSTRWRNEKNSRCSGAGIERRHSAYRWACHNCASSSMSSGRCEKTAVATSA